VREQNNDPDHFLLRVKYREKINKIQDYKCEKRKKWYQEKVDYPGLAKEYRKGITIKMAKME
jgi:hypothetical protein